MSPTPEPATWTVTKQTRTVGQTPSGQFSSGYDVAFTLSSGEAGDVFVPDAAYNAANVATMVSAAAAQLAAVSGLSGPVGG